MNPIIQSFSETANSLSVDRLLALAEITKTIPDEKMKKISKLSVEWISVGCDHLPKLNLEFFN